MCRVVSEPKASRWKGKSMPLNLLLRIYETDAELIRRAIHLSEERRAKENQGESCRRLRPRSPESHTRRRGGGAGDSNLSDWSDPSIQEKE